MRRFVVQVLVGCAVALAARPASAQQPLGGYDNSISFKQERLGDHHWRLTGSVELEQGGTKIYCDQADLYTDQDRAEFTGNVVVTQGANRIAADRAVFNTKTKLGTFYNATGIATLKPQNARRQPMGGVAPPPTGRDTDVYFYGESVEKLAPQKYKIIKGGFTTCVQPTPRWELTSDWVILNIDHYTLLRNAVLDVKGVPMLYVPFLYYPTKKDDRATGFLLPTYGASTIQGQAIHNAFFWAIDRSQDATFMFDWFSHTGEGVGSEYRYNFGDGNAGNIRGYLLDSHAATYSQSDGTTATIPGSRSYEVRGGFFQSLPGGMRARGNVDYFSDIRTMQTFNTNIVDASRRQRSVGGNLVGAWGSYTLNATINWSEYYYGTSSTSVSGSTPRIAFSKNERPLFGTPFYFSVGTEYVRLVRDNADLTQTPPVDKDQSLTRLDVTPQIRYPFNKWQWFTVNSTFTWRDTYYTRSQDPATNAVIDQGINRDYFSVQSQIVGPVFTRIWDTPDNGYAEKFKHTIEPSFTVSRTSAVDNFNRIVQLEGADAVVGDSTNLTYGVVNRFYAKRRQGTLHQAREIVDVSITQSYYTDSRSSQFDQQYATSFTGAAPNHFSPIALDVRAMPTNDLSVTTHAEFDSRYHALRTISANGSYNWGGMVQTQVGWSKRAFIPELAGFNDPNYLDQYINSSTNVHTRDNRLGGLYSFNYDILRGSMLQQRITGFYNAQCCGIAFEYQAFSLGGISSYAGVLPADHRFFISFTLAGLGNFSPFSGAMGGVPR